MRISVHKFPSLDDCFTHTVTATYLFGHHDLLFGPQFCVIRAWKRLRVPDVSGRHGGICIHTVALLGALSLLLLRSKTCAKGQMSR